jgi:hypothetical protein
MALLGATRNQGLQDVKITGRATRSVERSCCDTPALLAVTHQDSMSWLIAWREGTFRTAAPLVFRQLGDKAS